MVGWCLLSSMAVGCASAPQLLMNTYPSDSVATNGGGSTGTTMYEHGPVVSPRRDAITGVMGWIGVVRRDSAHGTVVYSDTAGRHHELVNARDRVSGLEWSGDGQTVVYVEHAVRQIPGKQLDFGLPATESLGFRLMAVPAAGGVPRVLVESQQALRVVPAPPGAFAAYLIEGASFREPMTMHVTDLATGGDEVVGPINLAHQLAWSEDGTRLAYLDGEPGATVGKLTVFDRRTRERMTLTEFPTRQFRWQGKAIAYWLDRSPHVMGIDALDGAKPQQVTVDAAISAQESARGYYLTSPDGDKLLAVEQTFPTIRFKVYSHRVKRAVKAPPALTNGVVIEWLDNDRLVMLPTAYPGAAQIVAIDVPPFVSGPQLPVRFDLPVRTMGTQAPEWAFEVEAPYVGGQYRYQAGLTGPEAGVFRGVLTFKVPADGTYAVLLSKDVPVRVLAGGLYGAKTFGAPMPLQRVDGESHVRYDVTLKAGEYTLDLGPTSESHVELAIPQAFDPEEIGKGIGND
jgi:hypothetical protein